MTRGTAKNHHGIGRPSRVERPDRVVRETVRPSPGRDQVRPGPRGVSNDRDANVRAPEIGDAERENGSGDRRDHRGWADRGGVGDASERPSGLDSEK